jgi:hypothetical protein
MRTKEEALGVYKELYADYEGYLYQFPDGHWDYCTSASPIGKRLETTGEIYAGIKASKIEAIQGNK